MRTPADYVTSPSGRIHLADSIPGLPERTLCGALTDHNWFPGDETISGGMANCATCRRIFAAARRG